MSNYVELEELVQRAKTDSKASTEVLRRFEALIRQVANQYYNARIMSFSDWQQELRSQFCVFLLEYDPSKQSGPYFSAYIKKKLRYFASNTAKKNIKRQEVPLTDSHLVMPSSTLLPEICEYVLKTESPRDAGLFRGYFEDGYTQQELAVLSGISQPLVHRALSSICNKLYTQREKFF